MDYKSENILKNIQKGAIYRTPLEFFDECNSYGQKLFEDGYLEEFNGNISLTLKGIKYLESKEK